MRWSVVSVLAVLILAGCASSQGGEEEDVQDGPELAPVTPRSVADHLHNLSARIDGVLTVTEQYRTTITETIELDTWIIRPKVDRPVPVVLEVTPYYGGGEPASLGRLGHELIERGYAVGVSSVRGTGNSGGCFTQGGPEEAVDTAAVIEHVAGQDWSTGSVGLIGVSYPGTTPQDVWVEAPESLKTIVPISGISDLYKYNFVNGVPINVQGFGFNAYYWALVGIGAPPFGGTDPTDPATVPGAVAGEACADQVDVQQGGATSTTDGNKDDYWQVRDFHAELLDDWERNDERASVFYIHGLQDWNVKPHMMEDWLETLWDTGVPMKVWLGQWPHAWPASSSVDSECEASDDGVSACRADWWDQTLVAWFDHWLKGIDTGIMDAPAVQVQDDDGVWRHERQWPPTDVAWHRFGLHEEALHEGMQGSGSVAYHDANGGLVGTLPDGQPVPGREVARVEWRSEPLTHDWHISGLPVFHANVTAEGARASLILSLAEELPNGDLRSINFAAQSLNHVQSLASGRSDISGERQEVEVRFFPQDDVIHNGSRIVLIAAGNTVGGPGPSLQPVSDGGMIRIDLEGAWLDLPVDHSIVVEDPQPYVEG